MQYDLELLEDMITVTLDPKKIFLHPPTASEIAGYELFAISEKTRIKKRMKAITGRPLEEKHKEKYIQRNQQDIIVLKNILINYLMPKNAEHLNIHEGDSGVTRLYKLLFHCLRELLNYIEEFFRCYFNQDEYVPESYLMRSQATLIERTKILKRNFTKNKHDARLINIIFSPINKLCETDGDPVTYRHFLYMKRLITELEAVKQKSNPYLSISPLTEMLLYVNFNSGNFISYIIAEIVDIVNTLPEQQQKTERLLQWRKEVNQLPVKPDVALKPNCSTVKEQLNFWITEEIHYLESKQRLLSVAPVIKDEIFSDEEKLHFSVSVNVLALFARAAQDSMLLLNKKGTIIFKNISKYCRTIQAKNPGAGSMDKKSHVAERAHKEKAILVLQEMIKWVHGY